MKKKTVIISGGGTGGHIFPAIAIADALKERHPDLHIEFVGASDRMEMQRVPKAGYPITGLWISGIQRSQPWKNILFPFKLISSLWKSYQIIRKHKPLIAIGTGGFASGPLLYAAARNGVPTVIQEQNSYPGITNKILGKYAHKICVAFEGMERWFPKNRIVVTGNPIRENLLSANVDQSTARKNFKLKPELLTIFVTGGSLGAKSINQSTAQWVRETFDETKHQLIWQTGSTHAKDYLPEFEKKSGIWISAFVDDMSSAYRAADIVVARAGASTLSEICALGKTAILIPSPYVAEDHQRKNAESLKENGAAEVVDEKNLTEFPSILNELITNVNKRELIAENALRLGKPQATLHIVEQIEALL